MIEVTLYRSGKVVAAAEEPGDDPEVALFAARTLWDEDCDFWPVLGADKVRRIVFSVNEEPVISWEGRRP
jgi:hypothetical protein